MQPHQPFGAPPHQQPVAAQPAAPAPAALPFRQTLTVVPPPRPVTLGAFVILVFGNRNATAGWIFLLLGVVGGWIGQFETVLVAAGILCAGIGALATIPWLIYGFALRSRVRNWPLNYGRCVEAKERFMSSRQSIGFDLTFHYRDAAHEASHGQHAPLHVGKTRVPAEPSFAFQEQALLCDPHQPERVLLIERLPCNVGPNARGAIAPKSVGQLAFFALLPLVTFGGNASWMMVMTLSQPELWRTFGLL